VLEELRTLNQMISGMKGLEKYHKRGQNASTIKNVLKLLESMKTDMMETMTKQLEDAQIDNLLFDKKKPKDIADPDEEC